MWTRGSPPLLGSQEEVSDHVYDNSDLIQLLEHRGLSMILSLGLRFTCKPWRMRGVSIHTHWAPEGPWHWAKRRSVAAGASEREEL